MLKVLVNFFFEQVALLLGFILVEYLFWYWFGLSDFFILICLSVFSFCLLIWIGYSCARRSRLYLYTLLNEFFFLRKLVSLHLVKKTLCFFAIEADQIYFGRTAFFYLDGVGSRLVLKHLFYRFKASFWLYQPLFLVNWLDFWLGKSVAPVSGSGQVTFLLGNRIGSGWPLYTSFFANLGGIYRLLFCYSKKLSSLLYAEQRSLLKMSYTKGPRFLIFNKLYLQFLFRFIRVGLVFFFLAATGADYIAIFVTLIFLFCWVRWATRKLFWIKFVFLSISPFILNFFTLIAKVIAICSFFSSCAPLIVSRRGGILNLWGSFFLPLNLSVFVFFRVLRYFSYDLSVSCSFGVIAARQKGFFFLKS